MDAARRRTLETRRRSRHRTASRALTTMISKTGWTSVGELLITRRISLVAVCCSSASVRSAFLACSSLSSRAFSMAITAWSANVLSSAISAGAKAPGPSAGDGDGADGSAFAQHRHRDGRTEAAQPGVLAEPRVPGRVGGHVDDVLHGPGQHRPTWSRSSVGRLGARCRSM